MRGKKDEGKQEIITGKAVFARPNRTKKEANRNSAFGTFGTRLNPDERAGLQFLTLKKARPVGSP